MHREFEKKTGPTFGIAFLIVALLALFSVAKEAKRNHDVQNQEQERERTK